MTYFCERGNQPSGSIKGRTFPDCLLKEDTKFTELEICLKCP